MWIINNSLNVIHTLEDKQLAIKKPSTWDFSTLHTSLPHARLKTQLHDLLERVFNTRGKRFIATNNFRTFWTNDRKSTKYTYVSCRELCSVLTFLSTISPSVSETRFFDKLLVYRWALTVHPYWLICSSTLSSTISCSQPFVISTIYSA